MIAQPMPCIWFDDQAEDAAKPYTCVIPNSRVVATARYPKTGQEITGKGSGSVMTVDLELNGQRFQLLDGGPMRSAGAECEACADRVSNATGLPVVGRQVTFEALRSSEARDERTCERGGGERRV